MGWTLGFLGPVTQIRSRISESIEFQTVDAEGKVSTLKAFRLPRLESMKMIEADKEKVFSFFSGERTAWKIHVLLDGYPTGLYLKAIQFLGFARIIFEYETSNDGGRVLSARGLTEESFGRITQLRGLGTIMFRNQKYDKFERRNIGAVDIVKVKIDIPRRREHEAVVHRSTTLLARDCDDSSYYADDFHDAGVEFPTESDSNKKKMAVKVGMIATSILQLLLVVLFFIWKKRSQEILPLHDSPLLLDELPSLAVRDGDDGNTEGIFSGPINIQCCPNANASSEPRLQPTIDRQSSEVLEGEEGYSPTATLLNSGENDHLLNWLSYIKKLKDLGFTVRNNLLGTTATSF